MSIQVIGIDPSFRNLGLAHAHLDIDSGALDVERVELVKTESRATKGVRKNSDDLRCARELVKALETACRHKAVAFAEVPQGSQSARSSWALGIALCALATLPIPLIEVSPTEVKLWTVGSKTASKQAMIDWAVERHPGAGWLTRKHKGEEVLTAANEHVADAVGAIHAGIDTPQFKSIVAVMRAQVG